MSVLITLPYGSFPNSLSTTRERRPTPSTSRGWTHMWILVTPISVPSKTPPPLKSPSGMWTKRPSSLWSILSWTCMRTHRVARRWAAWRLEILTAGTVLSGKTRAQCTHNLQEWLEISRGRAAPWVYCLISCASLGRTEGRCSLSC